MKWLQQYCFKDRVFDEDFKHSWHDHHIDYIENSRRWDIPDEDTILVFGTHLLMSQKLDITVMVL